MNLSDAQEESKEELIMTATKMRHSMSENMLANAMNNRRNGFHSSNGVNTDLSTGSGSNNTNNRSTKLKAMGPAIYKVKSVGGGIANALTDKFKSISSSARNIPSKLKTIKIEDLSGLTALRQINLGDFERKENDEDSSANHGNHFTTAVNDDEDKDINLNGDRTVNQDEDSLEADDDA